MPKSLLEQLPEIVANGRKEAEKILENLESRHRVTLQTREVVLPAKDSNVQDWVTTQSREAQREAVFSPNQGNLIAPVQANLDGASQASAWTNRLIYGDNLLAMAALLAGDDNTPSLRGKVDLIYIDPPFDSKADYRTKVNLPGVELEQKPTVIEQFAYSDTWSDGTASYLAMITPRLILMRELLADTGSIYVHIDARLSHYLKIVMDEVFARHNFVSQIIWNRSKSKLKATSNKWLAVDDQILMYGKTESRKFNLIYWPYTEEYKARFNIQDEHGVYYWAPIGTHSTARLEKLMALGRVRLPIKNGVMPRIKNYLHEGKGIPPDNLWTDIDAINSQANEDTGYDTQKPFRFLQRIIESGTDEGDLVLDVNGGSGTTAAVAEKLGRRWITSDLGKPACMIMRKRLIDQDAKPFLYQAIGDYQVETAKATLGRDFKIGDLAQIVLSLYGALPLNPDDNPQRNLGQIAGIAGLGGGAKDSIKGGSKTLVLADSPNKLTGATTLKKAQALRDNLLGGWDRVVVLGWNFEPSIGETISALNDSRLEVLVIPPDLMDRLKKKGGLDKLRGQVRFSSLQYMTIHPIERTTSTNEETLTVKLKNYVLLSPEAINLDEANREKLQAVINKEPLALIEYWAVDPDYDGKVFRSVWQDYRGNTANDEDALRVTTSATLTLRASTQPRRVCVRVVDVFGFEAEVVTTVPAGTAR